MILKRKALTLTVLLISIYVLSIFSQPFENTLPSSANVSYRPQIILDAGHGGLTNTIN